MENFKIHIKNIHQSLDQLWNDGILSRTERVKIKQIVEVMEKRIRNNEEPVGKEGQQIEGIISTILKMAINRPVTPNFKKLVNSFMSLVNYWNDKIGGQSSLKNSISTVQKFVDYHLTVIDTIIILRKLIPRMEQMLNFTPPVFELSKHYLKSLESLSNKKSGNAKKKNSH